ncbi:MAG TPA: NUDIX domain-containing protein [Flavipsychrobacter sp.]|nr:NUDIX domain-containing protein [Flavipsychrobacter sp.]
MSFAQKIYYNNKPLILTTDSKEYIKEHTIAAGYMLFTGAFIRNFRLAVQHLEKITALGAIIEDDSEKSLQKELYNLYNPIAAGGGVVFNEDGAVLMIYRRGKWDLPKGKCDEGEEIDYCALREVSEETGLQQLTLGEKVCDTYHVYSQNGQSLLKCTTWFAMYGTTHEKLTPQKEENILEAKWIHPSNMGPVVFKSYEAIREVLREAGVKW